MENYLNFNYEKVSREDEKVLKLLVSTKYLPGNEKILKY